MTLRVQHQELVELAGRIVHRQHVGQPDIAAELIMRALATSDADNTFALALALAEKALESVEESRLDAVEADRPWRPAMRLSPQVLVTHEDTAVAPVPLAMRLIEALHRSLTGDKDALADLDAAYAAASTADDAVFHGMFAALATYAARGRAENVEITLDEATAG